MKLIPWILVSGAALSFLAVLVGAFGAHGLEAILIENDRLSTFETASFYHFFHALALLIVSVLGGANTASLTHKIVAACFIVGICIFSGSLYVLSVTNLGWIGAITPIGGVILLVGWIGVIKVGFECNRG